MWCVIVACVQELHGSRERIRSEFDELNRQMKAAKSTYEEEWEELGK
jgi:hypothetical protein